MKIEFRLYSNTNVGWNCANHVDIHFLSGGRPLSGGILIAKMTKAPSFYRCMILHLVPVAGGMWEVPLASLTIAGGKSGPCLPVKCLCRHQKAQRLLLGAAILNLKCKLTFTEKSVR